MKLLVLGGHGMLGHMLVDVASAVPGVSVTMTGRGSLQHKSPSGTVEFEHFDAAQLNFGAIHRIFDQRFDYCVNCIGAVKQLKGMSDADMYYLNAAFPSLLANVCKLYQTRLIHVSTDCVFVGDRGGYIEADTPDAQDSYGHSKFLGEQIADSALVLRTSIVGPELDGSRRGLLGWFLGESESVSGFTQAYFSGVTTLRLSEFIVNLVQRSEWEPGLFHLAGPRISKYDLLALFKRHFGLTTVINASDKLKIDRSLVNDRIASLGYEPQPWEDMLQSLALYMNHKGKN